MTLGACALGVTLPLAASAQPTISGTPDEARALLMPQERFEDITGYAELRAYRDQARIGLLITTQDARLSDAIAANARARETVAQRLRAAGVPAADIQNAQFATSPQFGWFGDKPKAFEVVNRMTVSVTQEEQLKAVAAAADAHEEISIAGMTFEHTKKDAFEKQVKQAALEKMQAQKELYEAAFGVKLVLVNFDDDKKT